MTRGTDVPASCRVPAKHRRSLYFGLELWLVLEITCLIGLLLIEVSPTVRWIGVAVLLVGLVGVIFLLRRCSRRERQVG